MNEQPKEKKQASGPLSDRYHIQNGCWNCMHCITIVHYDEGDDFYCTHNAPPRPPSGSFAMPPREAIYDRSKNTWEEMADAEDAWEAWSAPRQVQTSGICEKWEQIGETK